MRNRKDNNMVIGIFISNLTSELRRAAVCASVSPAISYTVGFLLLLLKQIDIQFKIIASKLKIENVITTAPRAVTKIGRTVNEILNAFTPSLYLGNFSNTVCKFDEIQSLYIISIIPTIMPLIGAKDTCIPFSL